LSFPLSIGDLGCCASFIGGGTIDAHEAMQKLIVTNIMAYLAGQPLKTPVPELHS
jgi:glyoxylate reductase